MSEADAVFVQTDLERDFLAQKGVPLEKMVKTSIGVNIDEVLGGDAGRFRNKYEIDGPIVFYVGVTAYDKGTVHLVDAMRNLWQQGLEATLVLAGPTMDHFMKYYESLPDQDRRRCKVLGFIPEEDKKDLFAAGDVFVMPSRTDSFGIVFLEAWLYNKPVIGADAGGVPEVIDNNQNGFLVKFGDVSSLADRISILLQDRKLASRMGLAGERKVRENYLWDIVYERIHRVYMRMRDER